MTQYASVHPQSYGHVNRVREGVVPAFCACNRVCVNMEGHWIEITTNDPNPILMDVRNAVQDVRGRIDWAFILRRFIQWTDRPGGAYITLDYNRIDAPEYIDHARKVLTRLASLHLDTERQKA